MAGCRPKIPFQKNECVAALDQQHTRHGPTFGRHLPTPLFAASPFLSALRARAFADKLILMALAESLSSRQTSRCLDRDEGGSMVQGGGSEDLQACIDAKGSSHLHTLFSCRNSTCSTQRRTQSDEQCEILISSKPSA